MICSFHFILFSLLDVLGIGVISFLFPFLLVDFSFLLMQRYYSIVSPIFNSSKSKLEDFMQDYFSFLGKQLLKYLNVNCLFKGGLFCKIETWVPRI